MFEVGKLYKSPENYLLLYGTKEIAMKHSHPAALAPGMGSLTVVLGQTRSKVDVVRVVESWSKYYDHKVRYINPNDIFMCLSQNKNVMQILYGEHIGWIRIEDWLNIKRVDREIA